MSSLRGEVNGWWEETQRAPLSLHSNIGYWITKAKARAPGSGSFSRPATSRRRPSSALLATPGWSATISSMSPRPAPAQRGLSRAPSAGDAGAPPAPAGGHRLAEDDEFAVPQGVGEVDELQAVAQVRLVRPEAAQRLLVGHAGEGVRLHLEVRRDGLHRLVVQLLQELQHVLLVGDEAHLQVELGVLRLAVRAQGP